MLDTDVLRLYPKGVGQICDSIYHIDICKQGNTLVLPPNMLYKRPKYGRHLLLV